ncbi:MAG: alpha amylase C-terminal domain-containing protein [Desulfobacteraceae bacterium]|nr:alpha amylase C-terminal domain-containing protein [Desulfobacteraceae bacterium]
MQNKTEKTSPQQKKLIELDPLLEPYAQIIAKRAEKISKVEHRLTGGHMTLADFASGHEYFGLHFTEGRWIFREWAPNAEAIYLIGDMTKWQEDSGFALQRNGEPGVWEIHLNADTLAHKNLYRLRVYWQGGGGDRIPAYARRVVQDPDSLIFNAQVWQPQHAYKWRNPGFKSVPLTPLIYEAHVGMAQEEEKIGTYREFTRNVLPRIADLGYNTIQLMAVQEHPYYASFGYQVSNFFAASSRFGTPEDLKELVDEAHGAGIAVIMDIVHSHAVTNEIEGLSRFDGTPYQYFHAGPRGYHPNWGSRLFDYTKPQVLHFLLSNCRFWLDEYGFDGFRFDGITSMLYTHHGMGKAFVSYDDYFDNSVDEDALAYLTLANRLIHELRPEALTIAEDVSGMPGLALENKSGGTGFDFRFAMGIPDYWIKVIKEYRDENWPIGGIWYELTNRRGEEKTISYAESHDQAMVGDQTLIFRLAGADMYYHMRADDPHPAVDRAIALHKMIRLATLATAGHGYLNFMGNEFGHPEWIDFPRHENGWSYKYARRQWHLADAKHLKYKYLLRFDRKMIETAKKYNIPGEPGPRLLHQHEENKVLAFERDSLVFVFNFHPAASYTDYRISAPAGKYRMILNSDDTVYGGHGRLKPNQEHFTIKGKSNGDFLQLYLPTRTAAILQFLS